jgi:hypothetical protein
MINCPQPGDTLFIEDTITIKYSVDSTESLFGTAVVTEISMDGRNWYDLCPIKVNGCGIPFSSNYSGNGQYAVPEQIGYPPANTKTNNLRIILSDYNDALEVIPDTVKSIVITYKPLPQSSLNLIYPNGNDTLYSGDTIEIIYEVDSSYAQRGEALRLEITLNGGKEWLPLCLSKQSTGQCIVSYRPGAPDSVHVIVPMIENASSERLISDSALVRIGDVTEASYLPKAVVDKHITIIQREETYGYQKEQTRGNRTACGSGAGIALFPFIVGRIFAFRKKNSGIYK